jgi:uncharacterized protein YbjT (DUF2867 family)
MTNLIVGATGLVGGEICRLLSPRRERVRALVRESSSAQRVAQLEELGVKLVRGDLKQPATLATACRGVDVVISTASSTLNRQPGDSIATVDQQGQLDLIDVAASEGVRHFVLVSFAGTESGLDFPLKAAKRAAEERLQRSGMTYTILQPTAFFEVWLSPALGFDVSNGQARVYGSGENRTSFISLRDVARFAVAALDAPAARDAKVRLGGPEAVSPLEVVQIARDMLGREIAVLHVPEEALQAQYLAATDPMEKSFAGLMLYAAQGDVIDMSETMRSFGVDQMGTIREHLAATLGQAV